jgi:uncharacterized protein
MTKHLTVLPAGSKGKGVFAKSAIRQGALVVRYAGKARWIWDIPEETWPHCFQVDFDRYVAPRRGSYGWFVNHSCDPSCVIRGSRDVVAARKIAPGEEITFDYSTNVGWEGFEMRCSCGAARCRGVITSYARLGEDFKHRYGGNISRFLLQE